MFVGTDQISKWGLENDQKKPDSDSVRKSAWLSTYYLSLCSAVDDAETHSRIFSEFEGRNVSAIIIAVSKNTLMYIAQTELQLQCKVFFPFPLSTAKATDGIMAHLNTAL